MIVIGRQLIYGKAFKERDYYNCHVEVARGQSHVRQNLKALAEYDLVVNRTYPGDVTLRCILSTTRARLHNHGISDIVGPP